MYMKRYLILSYIFLSTPVFAGDAPTDITGGEFEGFVNLKTEAYVLAGNCQLQASVADVFGNEIGNDVGADLVTIGFASGSTLPNADDIDEWTFDVDPCDGHDQSLKLEMDELFFGTSTNVSDDITLTLANTFKFDDKSFSPELSLEGTFGILEVKEAKTAVDGLLKGRDGSGSKTAIDVVSTGHLTSTSGSKNAYNITYYTPSLSGLEMAVGTSISDRNIGNNDSEYTTMSLGLGYETYVGDVVISLGGGIETANNRIKDASNCLTDDLSKADSATDADTLFDGLYGGTACGDEILSALGMDLSFDNYTLSTAFSNLNSENADTDVWSIGFGSSLKDVDYTIGYSQQSLDYARTKVSGEKVENKSTIISLDATKPLNENIDLGLSVSSSDMDKPSQELGNGPDSAWRAGVSIAFGF